MKLRDLFDRLTPGMLDEEVAVKYILNAGTTDADILTGELKSVIITDTGKPVLIVHDILEGG